MFYFIACNNMLPKNAKVTFFRLNANFFQKK